MKNRTIDTEEKLILSVARGEVKKLSKEELLKSRMGRLARYPGPELFDDEPEKCPDVVQKKH